MKFYTIVLLIFLISGSTFASRTYETENNKIQINRSDSGIKIDGYLNESAWQNSTGISEFVQKNPNEGSPPTEKTIVYMTYDDEAIYVAARMFDSNPDSIIARLGRRDDWMTSDVFGFYVDPYYDRRSGFYFAINAAGTLYDGVCYNDDWDDDSWDGVWEGKARIEQDGWVAEFKVPFSQLRFKKKDHYVWGVNFRRDIARKNEEDFLVFTPKNGSGFVSRFYDLVGIENIEPPRNLEILPYFRNKAAFTHSEAGDPFNDGSTYSPAVGGDVKVGLSSNVTLDLTVNPDFGQVEVDPAVVNLSDVETFFSEKRPFFIEGSSIFDFGYGGSNSNWGFNWGNPNFFYSRRIGRAPRANLPDHDFADVPDGTTIISAAKITGKIGNNWNIGTIHAVTAREFADLDSSGHRSSYEVEPLTYYGIMRAQKEFNKGKQGLGFISTLTHRYFKENYLEDEINSDAFTFGLDGWTFLDQDKVWVITAWGGMSNVHGSEARITDLQTNPLHYFQMPDSKNLSVDSSATSMTGFSGRVLLNKQKGNIIFNSAIGFVDPEFDVNDMGYMWRTNIINAHIGGGYKWVKPGRYTRYAKVLGALFGSKDFDGNTVGSGIWSDVYLQFPNYYEMEISSAYNPESISNRRTRGGPLTINRPGYEVNAFANSDERKNWVFGFGTYGYICESGSWNRGVELETEWKPAANLSVTVSPEIEWNHADAQWVDSFDDIYASHTFGQRYVFAEMDQLTASASVRVNWTFTPKLSLQIYAQPLISSGDYHHFKELARSKSYDFFEYEKGESGINYNGDSYIVDPDGSGPAGEISWDQPDFNFKSLRGNAVLRWEYMPGSTFYLVWTQNRSDFEDIGEFRLSRSLSRLVDADSDNILMVKISYWLNI